MNLEPIFIVGAPRSGTTLLSAMISSHSNIACGPETQFFNKLAPEALDDAVRDLNWPKKATNLIQSLTLSGQKVYELFDIQKAEIYEYLSKKQPSISVMLESLTYLHAKKANKVRWAEKTPNHILHLQQIRELFPNSPIIRIIRDPRDSANSMTKLPWASDSVVANAYLWNDWHQSSKTFFKYDINTLTVRYEDLVLESENVLKTITDFIGEEFEETMLDTSKSGKTVSSANETWKSDVSKPLDPSKLYQWKKTLQVEMINAVSFACIDGILSFGYELEKRPSKFFLTFPLTRSFIEDNIENIVVLSDRGIALLDENNPLRCQRLLILRHTNMRGLLKSFLYRASLIVIILIRKYRKKETYCLQKEGIRIGEQLNGSTKVTNKYCKSIVE